MLRLRHKTVYIADLFKDVVCFLKLQWKQLVKVSIHKVCGPGGCSKITYAPSDIKKGMLPELILHTLSVYRSLGSRTVILEWSTLQVKNKFV